MCKDASPRIGMVVYRHPRSLHEGADERGEEGTSTRLEATDE